jgi:hypothetical protein
VGFTPLAGEAPLAGAPPQNAKTKKRKNQKAKHFFFGGKRAKEEYVIRKRDSVYFTFAIAIAKRTSVCEEEEGEEDVDELA